MHDANGLTPFLAKLATQKVEDASQLLKFGANPFASDLNGRNAVHICSRLAIATDGTISKPCVEWFISNLGTEANFAAALDASDTKGRTPLLAAIEKVSQPGYLEGAK